MKRSPFVSSCKYDYEHKCDCSEDDNCGCDYPNNMEHGYTKECLDDKFDEKITDEKLHIKINEVKIFNKKEKSFRANLWFFVYSEGRNFIMYYYYGRSLSCNMSFLKVLFRCFFNLV